MQGVGTLESPGGEPKYFNTTGHYYQWVEAKYHYSYTEFSIGINWQTAQVLAHGLDFSFHSQTIVNKQKNNSKKFEFTRNSCAIFQRQLDAFGRCSRAKEGTWRQSPRQRNKSSSVVSSQMFLIHTTSLAGWGAQIEAMKVSCSTWIDRDYACTPTSGLTIKHEPKQAGLAKQDE